MITIRKSKDRGFADHQWLQSRHTFSFADYHDPAHMGFRTLRVINEDSVAPGMGFGTHPHRDMEIFSYILEGALQHKDSMGNGSILQPGHIQLMSAGSGVAHSEFNPSRIEPVHFLQIWIRPRERGIAPSYTEWHPDPSQENQAKVLVISEDGREGSATIHQDASVYRLRLKTGAEAEHILPEGRGAWLRVMRGSVRMNDLTLDQGDAASSETAGTFRFVALQDSEALLFDLR